MLVRVAVAASLAGLLAGCSSDISMEDFNFARRTRNFVNSQALSFSAPERDFSVRPVTQADLIGPQGQCAGTPAADPKPAEADTGVDESVLVRGGIALRMTECEVVNRAGPPDDVKFGTNARGEREVVMTYLRGYRPGIYRFDAGRLKSIGRVPEPEKPKTTSRKRRHRS
jgi:hypothetical protein